MVSIGLAVSTTFTPAVPPTTDISLSSPSIIASYNLPSETATILEDPQKIQTNTEEIKKVVIEEEPIPEAEPTHTPLIEKEKKPLPKVALATKVPEKVEDSVVKETPPPVESPIPTPRLNQSMSGAETLFQLTNQYRAKLSLPNFEKDEAICKIAELRAPQIYDEVFISGPMHKGFYSLNLPYWATENIAAYQTIDENFNFWITDYIHRKSIEGDYKYSCVACSNTSCSQIFTSFIPK